MHTFSAHHKGAPRHRGVVFCCRLEQFAYTTGSGITSHFQIFSMPKPGGVLYIWCCSQQIWNVRISNAQKWASTLNLPEPIPICVVGVMFAGTTSVMRAEWYTTQVHGNPCEIIKPLVWGIYKKSIPYNLPLLTLKFPMQQHICQPPATILRYNMGPKKNTAWGQNRKCKRRQTIQVLAGHMMSRQMAAAAWGGRHHVVKGDQRPPYIMCPASFFFLLWPWKTDFLKKW